MAGVRALPPPDPRPMSPCHFLALLGASVVLFSVAGEPSGVHAEFALAGFLLWLLGVAHLQFGHRLPGAPAIAATSPAVEEELKNLVLGRHDAVAA
uniref:Uncharacterized protein n=1 Tax=Setaria viridis TaxID=4556 RepID=A0A4U6V9S6_SETVI|nr:hypothetical protein SEVIR_3G158833v2 [Setaria viridis]